MFILFHKFMRGAVIASAMFASTLIGAETVVVNATGVDDHLVVQEALDTYKDGTTFLLKGNFAFNDTVYVKYSDVTLLGEYEDSNEDGKVSTNDSYTVIDGSAYEAFMLGSEHRNKLPLAEPLSNIVIRNFHFKTATSVNIPFELFTLDPCPSEVPLYKGVDNLLIENNYMERAMLRIARSNLVTINNNLFTTSDLYGRAGNAAALISGYQIAKHYPAEKCTLDFQRVPSTNVSFTNNMVEDGRYMQLASVKDAKVSGNTFTGINNYAWAFAYPRIITKASEDVLISNNEIDGIIPQGMAIHVFSTDPYITPNAPQSENIDIKHNVIKNVDYALLIQGGLKNSSIKGNNISNVMHGLAYADHDRALNKIPSSRVDVTNNHIADAVLTGIGINAGVTEVRIVNNTFDNVAWFSYWSRYIGVTEQDVILFPFDVFYGIAIEPAYGNTVITSSFSTNVFDGNDPDLFGGYFYQGGKANKMLGANNLVQKGIGDLPAGAQEAILEASRPPLPPNEE